MVPNRICRFIGGNTFLITESVAWSHKFWHNCKTSLLEFLLNNLCRSIERIHRLEPILSLLWCKGKIFAFLSLYCERIERIASLYSISLPQYKMCIGVALIDTFSSIAAPPTVVVSYTPLMVSDGWPKLATNVIKPQPISFCHGLIILTHGRKGNSVELDTTTTPKYSWAVPKF